MIRLTELERRSQAVVVKVEGSLTASTLQVLEQSLAEYQQQGVREVQLWADGLLSVDQLALEKAQQRFPAGLDISFHTSRLVMQKLLENCGATVVFH
ncbi:MAG: hypothetical protein HYW07_05305 [Candidatus Latescibacteria bacterium]|nr:hypothetical protein [Candidatus Latescibacterota bacterium]